ncbi:MAG TPA: hypothetical protein VN783_05710, partial [Thermoanaerobaculia bacterium]|nr:hypothetical protein [Thermoanaerobaculia bacterium]
STAELSRMADQIQDLEGQSHALAKKRQALSRQGADEANRLKAHLRALLGPKNPELVKFGIRPQERRKPRAPSETAKKGKAAQAQAVPLAEAAPAEK